MTKQINKLDWLKHKAQVSFLTKEEEAELKVLHAEHMEFLRKGFEWDGKAISRNK